MTVFVALHALVLLGALQGGNDSCVLEQQRVFGSTPHAEERLGQSIAVDGDTIAVGAETDPNDTGAVYVFTRTGLLWSQQAMLQASDGGIQDVFGWSVDVQGDKLVVGAPEFDDLFSNSGAIYFFERNGTSWTESQQFLHPWGTEEGRLGECVALDGDRCVVGAPSQQGGAAFVYSRSGSQWSLLQNLDAPGLEAGDGFGECLAISGDVIIVGAVGDDDGGSLAGAAYVFEWSGTKFVQTAKLIPADVDPADGFGFAVTVFGDTIFGSAPAEDEAGNFAGAIYRFEKQGGTWIERQKLIASDAVPSRQLGLDLDLDDGRVIAAAGEPGGVPGSHTSYLFVRDEAAGTWFEETKLLSRDPGMSDLFGIDGAIDGDTIAIAARGDQGEFPKQGSIYTFAISQTRPCPAIYCTAKSSSCGTLPRISALGVSRASDSSGFEVYATLTKAARSGFLVYTDAGPAAIPFQGGTLCLNPVLLRRSVPVSDTTGTGNACDGALLIDMNAFAAGTLGGHPLPSLSIPGTQVHCQFWARDTVANGSLLSDALQYFVGL